MYIYEQLIDLYDKWKKKKLHNEQIVLLSLNKGTLLSNVVLCDAKQSIWMSRLNLFTYCHTVSIAPIFTGI